MSPRNRVIRLDEDRRVLPETGHRRPDGERALLADRLRARLREIERAALTRARAISDPAEVADPSYAEGLRTTVKAALEYAAEALERGEERTPPPPPALLAQARLAARNGVGLDTVLRRYFAGYTLLGDILAAEAERHGTSAWPFPGRAALFDRLIAAVSEEYRREAAGRQRSAEQRRAERVCRLLDGEPLDTSELRYDFSATHLAAIVAGPDAVEALRALTGSFDCRQLLISPEDELAWAWFGGRRPPDPADLLGARWPDGLSVAIGEPGEDLAGWRLTHRQAAAALPIAQRGVAGCVRYRDVALMTSVVRDDVLTASLQRLYLEPLEAERDGGEALRQTLRAHMAAGRNVSSTAMALGVNRKTVASRLRAAEALLGRPLGNCVVELEIALRLRDLEAEPDPSPADRSRLR